MKELRISSSKGVRASPETYLKPGCEKCKFMGYFKMPKMPIGWTRRYCDCWLEYEYKMVVYGLCEDSNLPYGRLVDNPLSFFSGNLKRLEKFCSILKPDAEQNWLYLVGSAGSGKTAAAMAVAQVALSNEMPTYFTTVTDLLADMRPSNTDEEQRDSLMNTCRTVPLLILDDIGQEKSSEWVREQLYRIINARWNEKLPTVFTSNSPLSEIRETISEAVYSRIRGQAIVLTMSDEKDRRIEK